MLPVLLGQKESVRSSLVIEDRAIRNGPWKLIFGYGMGGVHRNYRPTPDSSAEGAQGELYNLNNDRSEQHNLYEEHPGRVKDLKELFQDIKN